jgi:hypothetical protein
MVLPARSPGSVIRLWVFEDARVVGGSTPPLPAACDQRKDPGVKSPGVGLIHSDIECRTADGRASTSPSPGDVVAPQPSVSLADAVDPDDRLANRTKVRYSHLLYRKCCADTQVSAVARCVHGIYGGSASRQLRPIDHMTGGSWWHRDWRAPAGWLGGRLGSRRSPSRVAAVRGATW